jgi:hypothetical protein
MGHDYVAAKPLRQGLHEDRGEPASPHVPEGPGVDVGDDQRSGVSAPLICEEQRVHGEVPLLPEPGYLLLQLPRKPLSPCQDEGPEKPHELHVGVVAPPAAQDHQ